MVALMLVPAASHGEGAISACSHATATHLFWHTTLSAADSHNVDWMSQEPEIQRNRLGICLVCCPQPICAMQAVLQAGPSVQCDLITGLAEAASVPTSTNLRGLNVSFANLLSSDQAQVTTLC